MKLTSNFANMRTYAIAVVAGVLLVAGYSQKGEAAACAPTGTYAGLISAGSCDIADKTFSGFDFLTGDPITAAQVAYSTVNGTGGFWGFQFQFNLIANQADFSNDFFIAYDVACNALAPTRACIDSIHGEITGSGVIGGIVSLAETYNAGARSALLFLPGGSSSFDDTFNPVATLHVSKDINATCNPLPGSNEVDAACFATISAVRNTVDQVTDDTDTVPEPATLALLATGLVGLGWFGRRRRNQV